MPKVLANDGLASSGKVMLEEAGFEVITEKVPQDKLIEVINKENIEVLLVRSATKVRKDIIDGCPGLKMIGRGGVGMDNIDVDYARSKGRDVFNTPNASSESVAELTFAHLFGIARGLYDSNRQMPKNGNDEFASLKKKYSKGFELQGKTMGIIGFGRIGRATARIALGVGMRVITHTHDANTRVNLDLHPSYHSKVTVPIDNIPLDELLKESDIISLHVPFSSKDSAVLSTREFGLMKDGVVIINVARGGVVDEDELIGALNNGRVSHAGLDVFVGEPAPRKDLLEHPKVSLTPHIGAATMEAQERIGTELAEKIIREMAGFKV